MLQSNRAIFPPLVGTFTSPPKLHFLLHLHFELKSLPHLPSSLLLGPCALPPLLLCWRLCPCSLLRATPPLTDASALLSPTQGFTPAALPSASSALLMFSSHHFLVHKHAVLSLIFKKKSSLDSIFPFLVPSHKIIWKNIQSAISLLSFYLQPTWMRILSSFTPPTPLLSWVANEPHMLHPIDISHPLSSIWQWGAL